MNIVIADYGMGNVGSILNMLKYLDIQAVITDDPATLRKAGKIILPGVGSFDNGMNNLIQTGLYDALMEKALISKIPVLGICLGMQLMTHSSEEGVSKGLGWINASTIRFNFKPDSGLKVPHVGWNSVHPQRKHSLIYGIDESSKFYFVHSYYVVCNEKEDSLCKTSFGIPFDTIIARDNIFGCQFHPEKSHKFGMQLFKNFNNI